MKKNLTKKLMLSVLTLAFAVVSLGASTFAWFTFSNTAKVDAFSANVKGAEGIQIAVATKDVAEGSDAFKALEWYSGVLPTDAIKTAMGSVTFNAVTTADGLNYYCLDSADGTASNSASTGYVKFNVWIKSAEAGKLSVNQVVIENGNVVGESIVIPGYDVDATFPLAANPSQNASAGENWKFDVASAARVALFLGQAQDDSDNTKVYEASEVAADYASKNAGNSSGHVIDAGAAKYYNTKTEKQLDYGSTVELEAIDCATAASDLLSIQLTGADTVCLSVYVWIEGWDGECLNAIFSQKLSVSLGLLFEPTNEQLGDGE